MIRADGRVEIQITVDRYDLTYEWGMGQAVDLTALPERERHGPRFLNAPMLEVRGEAKCHDLKFESCPVIMSAQEIEGPEPSTYDAGRAENAVGCGHLEKKTNLHVYTGLARGALLALHHTLSHADQPVIFLTCTQFESIGLEDLQRSLLIRFCAATR